MLICGHVPARMVLYMLSWSGFLVSFMMRTDINLAIVAMVEEPLQNAAGNISSVADESERCYDLATASDGGNVSSTLEQQSPDYGERLDWSPDVQSYVLASFYWAYIVSQVVGGAATQRFGTKRVFGWAQLATAACSLCIPAAASTHHALVIALRCTQGFASGLTWPAMYALVGHWIPVPERSRFMSSFQGFSIGIGLTYPLCGLLIANWGWRSVFYTTGSVGAAWCALWYLLAFDSPESHPRITAREAQYIREHTVSTWATSRARRVPWTHILRSAPAWSIGVATFGRIWVHYTFIVPGPQYMRSVLGFSIQKNGLLSGAPFVCSYLSSVLFCYVADRLSTHRVLSLTNVRKLFTALAQVAPGLLCLLIGYVGCRLELTLTLWFVAVTLITAAYAGAMANVVDIAPNLAGPVLAFAQTIHMTASFLSPLAAGYLTRDGHTLTAWRHVFAVACAVACCTYLFYQAFGTADVQWWDKPDEISSPGRDKDVVVDGDKQDVERSLMSNGDSTLLR